MVPGAVGAIVGLIGTVISRFTDIWEKKEEAGIQLELAKRNKELAEIELRKSRFERSLRPMLQILKQWLGQMKPMQRRKLQSWQHHILMMLKLPKMIRLQWGHLSVQLSAPS